MVDVSKMQVGDNLTIRVRLHYIGENDVIYVDFPGCEDALIVTPDEIVTHEPRTLAQRLAGLTAEQIDAALARKDSALAEAFEAAGTQIARARRDAGDLKRRPKNTGTGETGATPLPQVAGEAHPVSAGADTPAADQDIGDDKTAMAASSSEVAAGNAGQREPSGERHKSATETAAAASKERDPKSPKIILAVAHAKAAEGRSVFNAWFRIGLTEPERATLDGHIKELLTEAESADLAKMEV